MDHHQRAELLGLLPERREGGIGQLLAGDVGEDFDALELELLHAALKLLRRLVAVRHRHAAERDQAVGMLADIFGDAVVEHARGLRPRSRAARCSRSAAAPGEMSCMSTPMSSIVLKRASVVADAARWMSACLLGHQRLGFGRREMVERDRSTCRDAAPRSRRRAALATWACMSMVRLFGRVSRPGLPRLRAAVGSYLFHMSAICRVLDSSCPACPASTSS